MEAILALEDGRIFRGRAFGARAERCGEVVFNTSMTGYQEVLTDPSYCGQIVTMTCPEIGNYGTNLEDQESGASWVEGFVVREVSDWPSNWRSNQGLPQYLKEHGTPGISGVDTRALTRHIRSRGAMRGIVSSLDLDAESLLSKVRQSPRLADQDLVARVSCAAPYRWEESRTEAFRTAVDRSAASVRLVAIDFGIKRNILRLLIEWGFDVTVVPAAFGADEIRKLAPEALFLSNGPGDPSVVSKGVETVASLMGEIPIFGICLGHQLIGQALGAKTFKLKFGHRGANHPVRDERSGRVAITSQNHGYAVDPDSLPSRVRCTHLNLNDQTLEGFVDPDARLMAVQYHPESSPGPHDSHHLFAEFRELVTGIKAHVIAGGEIR